MPTWLTPIYRNTSTIPQSDLLNSVARRIVEAHIVAKVRYTLGECRSDAGLVAFDEIVSAEANPVPWASARMSPSASCGIVCESRLRLVMAMTPG
jgi:hypothetical protein